MISNESFVLEFCIKHGINVTTFTYYRSMQIFHVILSAVAIPLILCVIIKYRKKLIFHYNNKVLFFWLYIASLLHAFFIITSQGYELFLSYTYIHPCDVIISSIFYSFNHLAIAFLILWIENTQVLMIFERLIAMICVSDYEKFTKKMGNCLLVFVILMSVSECVWGYRNGNFRTPHITCLETPPNSRSQINALIGFLIAVHITALLGIVFIYCVHRRRFRLVQSLSVRFQFSENLTSSRLIIALSTLQLMTFLMYGMAKVYLNSTHNPQKDDIPSYHSNMLAIYLISEYTLLLPLITMLFLLRAKQTRQSEIRSMIQVKASGAEGWANYSNQLQQQWNC